MSRSNQRRLLMESLEHRALLAADCHNLFAPLDVNNDSLITASDALTIINRLNGSGERLTNNPLIDGFVDVTDDGLVTPADALKVINWLNDQVSARVQPDPEWVKVNGEGDARVGVRMMPVEDGSVQIEVRLQRAAPGETKEIFLDDQWIGSVTVDARGRASLSIDSNKDLADRMAELLMEGRPSSTVVVGSIGQVELENRASKNAERSSENRRLLEGSVFSARLNLEGQQRGEVLFAKRGDREFLGFYARGLTAQQSYEIRIDGVVVDTATADRRGVIAKQINTREIENFPEIKAGTVVEVANYRGEFVTLKDRLQLPQAVYVANLSGNRLLGSAELIVSNERTVLGVQLGRVEANQTYGIFIDDVKVAEASTGPRGLLRFRYDSARGDQLLAELPTISENSVIRVGELARGRLVKLGR